MTGLLFPRFLFLSLAELLDRNRLGQRKKKTYVGTESEYEEVVQRERCSDFHRIHPSCAHQSIVLGRVAAATLLQRSGQEEIDGASTLDGRLPQHHYCGSGEREGDSCRPLRGCASAPSLPRPTITFSSMVPA